MQMSVPALDRAGFERIREDVRSIRRIIQCVGESDDEYRDSSTLDFLHAAHHDRVERLIADLNQFAQEIGYWR